MVSAGGRSGEVPTAEKTLETVPSMVSPGGRSGKSPTAKFHIYQPPSSLRRWIDKDHDLAAALRHLGLLDFARLQLPDGIPRPDLVTDLIASYAGDRRCGYVWGACVNVDRKSFLMAAALQATTEHKELPPNVHPSTVTRAAQQFMETCILPQFQGRDVLPSNVFAAMQEVKAGLAHKVDWGELIWDLIQNEILELPKRDDKNSYFGVHLQRLIWVQKPKVFGMKENDRVDRLLRDLRVDVRRLVREEVRRLVPVYVRNELERLVPVYVRNELDRLYPQLINNLSNLLRSGEAAALVQVQQQPMVVQSSQLAIVQNDDARVDKSDSMEPALVEPGEADAHKHGVKFGKQQFQQGNQQKRTRNRNKCSVPTGSTISTANSSHDIIGIEREVKRARLENQPSKELLEAEMFIQAVKVLKETLSAETILHMLKDSPASGSPLMCGDAVVEASK